MKVRKNRWRFYRKTGGPRQIGNRCKMYGAGCIVCEAYRLYDATGTFPTFDVAHYACREVMKNIPDDYKEMPWSAVRAAASIGEGLVQEKT